MLHIVIRDVRYFVTLKLLAKILNIVLNTTIFIIYKYALFFQLVKVEFCSIRSPVTALNPEPPAIKRF